MNKLLVMISYATVLTTLAVPCPVAYWSFDDASNLGKDMIGNDDLTVVGTTTDVAPKVLTAADGALAGGAVRMKRGSAVGPAFLGKSGALPTGKAAFTMTAWVRPDSGSKNSAYLVLHSPLVGGAPGGWTKAEGASSNWAGCWAVRFANNTTLSLLWNAWKYGTEDNDAAVLKMTIPSGCYNDGKWHHIALRKTAEGVANLFFDGAKSANKTFSAALNANDSLVLGSYETNNGFSGDYDEVKIYDVALSDEDILDEYARDTKAVNGAQEFADGNAGSARYYGDLTSATEVLNFGGVGYTELLAASAPSFAGIWRTYMANVEVGAPWREYTVPSAAKLEVANAGKFSFHTDTTVSGLSGVGLLGGVNIPAGKTLTVNSTDDETFAGQITGGGAFVKNGAGNLTISGLMNGSTVTINAGTLSLVKATPFMRNDIVGYWRFEDASSLGADSNGASRHNLSIATTDAKTPTEQLATGKISNCISMRKSSASVANALVSSAGVLPTGTATFTVSTWLRPNSDSPSMAYLMVYRTVTGGKPTSWSGAQWDGWHVRFNGSGKIAFGYTSKWENPVDARFIMGSVPSNAYKDGQWHHLVVTRDAEGTSTLYFDGAAVGSKKIAENQSIPTTARFAIGGQDSNNSFSGEYDEMIAYKRALSAAEVAALYACKRPEEEAGEVLPPATAHWTFDALEEDTESGEQIFRDFGVNEAHFKNTASSSGKLVQCVTGAGINGGAAYLKDSGSYLQMLDPERAKTNMVQYGWPSYTLSIRVKNVSCTSASRTPFICFGNAHAAETCMRLSYESEVNNDTTKPQILRVFPGGANSNGGYIINDALSTADIAEPWTTITLVQSMDGTPHMDIYRDGLFVQMVDTAGTGDGGSTYKFDLSRIDIGYNTYGTYCGFMVDDLRIFRKQTLTAAQIKRLVLEQAGLGLCATPLEQSAVSVAAGATLAVQNGAQHVQSLAGAGTVTIAADGSLAAADMSNFTGSITGAGTLKVTSQLPTAATINVSRMELAPSCEIDLGAHPAPGKYLIASGNVVAPDGIVGWTVKNLATDRYSFKITADGFYAIIRGGFMVNIR